MIELLFVITTVSLVSGAVAMAIAWRAVQENRRRSQARVARLSDAIYAAEPADAPPVAAPHLFDHVDGTNDRRRRLTTLGVAIAFGAIAIVVVVRLAGTSAPAAEAARGASQARASTGAAEIQRPATDAARTPAVLDLVSLVHERTSSGELDLHGEVHNPQKGATLEGVTAVAMVFDRQGAYLASGRAPLDVRATPASDTATFVISVPDATAAGSYRVSFRTRDRVIPHADRRTDREVSK